MTDSDDRFQAAIGAFDEANSGDPRLVADGGSERPAELVYAERMTRCLHDFAPGSVEPVRLAARSQHICRWMIPRSEYPMDRRGYHRWRKRLAAFHAGKAGGILEQAGYDEGVIGKVRDLLEKRHLGSDPDAQLLEDVTCLVFLEFYLESFSRKHEEAKLAGILKKTWAKMSPRARDKALELDLSPECRELIGRVVG